MSSIRVLKTFLAVARHGSFAAAGMEIGLTAAGVGLQMRALEEDLGQALFDRAGRSIVLNTTGRLTIAPVADLVRRFEALASVDTDGLSGTVVVGALVSALMGAFADALWALKREHPRLEVKLLAGLSADFAPKVERGELDAAVVTQPPRALPTGVKWTPLYSEPMILIVPRRPHFKLGLQAQDTLREAPYLRFDRNTWTGQLVEQVLSRAGVAVNESLELNSVEAIVALVRQGFGVSIVPQLDNVDWDHDRDLEVVPVPGNRIQRHVGLIERTSHSRTRFTDEIKQHFKTRAPRRRLGETPTP
ncbi:MAG: LysR family transcriptional regulator [Methylibium sp.]|nr:LysR family transcriptional regulator [Methylibium sp.]